MEYKLFFFLTGCKLANRFTEQHDVFFGIAKTPSHLIPAIKNFWAGAENLHIDCWREVTNINGYQVKVLPKGEVAAQPGGLSLFFINMGGYRKGEFEEFHFKDIFAAPNPEEAIKLAKKTSFYRNYGFKGAVAHVDNKYGVDVDEVYQIEEILSPDDKANYRIVVTNEIAGSPDEIHLGYTPLSKLNVFS